MGISLEEALTLKFHFTKSAVETLCGIVYASIKDRLEAQYTTVTDLGCQECSDALKQAL